MLLVISTTWKCWVNTCYTVLPSFMILSTDSVSPPPSVLGHACESEGIDLIHRHGTSITVGHQVLRVRREGAEVVAT